MTLRITDLVTAVVIIQAFDAGMISRVTDLSIAVVIIQTVNANKVLWVTPLLCLAVIIFGALDACHVRLMTDRRGGRAWFTC